MKNLDNKVSDFDLRDEQYKGFLIEENSTSSNKSKSENLVSELDLRSELYRGFDPEF